MAGLALKLQVRHQRRRGYSGVRRYNRHGGRPPLYVDFKAGCIAIQGAWSGSEETITGIAARFGSVVLGFINECTLPLKPRMMWRQVYVRPPSLLLSSVNSGQAPSLTILFPHNGRRATHNGGFAP